jgi:hypothetical protein
MARSLAADGSRDRRDERGGRLVSSSSSSSDEADTVFARLLFGAVAGERLTEERLLRLREVAGVATLSTSSSLEISGVDDDGPADEPRRLLLLLPLASVERPAPSFLSGVFAWDGAAADSGMSFSPAAARRADARRRDDIDLVYSTTTPRVLVCSPSPRDVRL